MKKRDEQLLNFIINWMRNPIINDLAAQNLRINHDGILCLEKVALFPMARYNREEKVLYLDFHFRYKNIILRILALDNQLAPYVDKWIFVQYLFPEKENMADEDLHYSNMFNIIDTHIQREFHNILNLTQFTLPNMLIRYIEHYNCHDIFENVCNRHLNELIKRKWFDNISGQYVYAISREIAGDLENISRKVIIEMLLRDLDTDEA